MTQYTIIIEDAGSNFGACAPDVPGCIVTGETVEETTHLMTEALEMHIQLLREMGEPIPVPHTLAAEVLNAS
jgi:predicted RNase H-like HicB family nuclease